MALRKCPRCELNYIKEDEKYCNVCRRNMKFEPDDADDMNLCLECGENPPLKGKDLCAYCYNEKRRREKLEKLMEKPASIEIDVEQLDEIDVDLPTDIPSEDLEDIHQEFGDMEEDEEERELESVE